MLPDEERRPRPQARSAQPVKHNKHRHQHANVQPRVALDQLAKATTCLGRRIPFAHIRHSQIVGEEHPDPDAVDHTQLKPGFWVRQAGEKQTLSKGACEVEKIVPKLQWPTDKSQRVKNRARPEDEDDAQSG